MKPTEKSKGDIVSEMAYVISILRNSIYGMKSGTVERDKKIWHDMHDMKTLWKQLEYRLIRDIMSDAQLNKEHTESLKMLSEILTEIASLESIIDRGTRAYADGAKANINAAITAHENAIKAYQKKLKDQERLKSTQENQVKKAEQTKKVSEQKIKQHDSLLKTIRERFKKAYPEHAKKKTK